MEAEGALRVENMSSLSPKDAAQNAAVKLETACAKPSVKPVFWLTFAVGLAVFALLTGAAKVIADNTAQKRRAEVVAHETLEAQRSVEVMAAIIERNLTHIRNIPTIIASESETSALLSLFGPDVRPSILPLEQRRSLWGNEPQLRAFSAHLDHVVGLSRAGINSCWLMNAAGDTVAAGLNDIGNIITGINYADREYFKQTMQGQPGRQFGIGRTSNKPALYFSSPIMKDGKFLGTVGVRTNLSNMAVFLHRNDFVSDAFGTVILARDESILLHTLPGAAAAGFSQERLEALYKEEDLPALPIEPLPQAGLPDLVRWRGQGYPSVFAEGSCMDGFLRVHSVRGLAEFGDIERERLTMFSQLSLIAFLLALSGTGAVAFVQRDRANRRALLRVNEELAEHARTDDLTGCANRRRFLEELSKEWSRQDRDAQPLSVLSMDLDHFKRINDRYGHPGGDKTLRRFVAAITGELRPSDLLGRMGGEEFCVLLPNTDLDAAALVAERLRKTIESSPVRQDKQTIRYTVSIGVAQRRTEPGTTPEDLLSRADKALYRAKHSGRNAVCRDVLDVASTVLEEDACASSP